MAAVSLDTSQLCPVLQLSNISLLRCVERCGECFDAWELKGVNKMRGDFHNIPY